MFLLAGPVVPKKDGGQSRRMGGLGVPSVYTERESVLCLQKPQRRRLRLLSPREGRVPWPNPVPDALLTPWHLPAPGPLALPAEEPVLFLPRIRISGWAVPAAQKPGRLTGPPPPTPPRGRPRRPAEGHAHRGHAPSSPSPPTPVPHHLPQPLGGPPCRLLLLSPCFRVNSVALPEVGDLGAPPLPALAGERRSPFSPGNAWAPQSTLPSPTPTAGVVPRRRAS